MPKNRSRRGGQSTATVPDFDNFKTYTVDDVVNFDGKTYKMTAAIGAAGYAPPAFPTHWAEIVSSSTLPSNSSMSSTPDFDNFKTYTVDDVVNFDGKMYKMTAAIGAAGYAPPAFPTHWAEIVSSSTLPSNSSMSSTTSMPPTINPPPLKRPAPVTAPKAPVTAPKAPASRAAAARAAAPKATTAQKRPSVSTAPTRRGGGRRRRGSRRGSRRH